MTNTDFQWQCQPAAENLLLDILQQAKEKNNDIASLENQLLKVTSTRLFDWIDHVIVPKNVDIEKKAIAAGFIVEDTTSNFRVFHHSGAQLPRLVIKDEENTPLGIAISVDSIEEYLMIRGILAPIEGSYFSRYRRACVSKENEAEVYVIERRGSLTMEPVYEEKDFLEKYLLAKQKWLTRKRSLLDQDAAMQNAIQTAKEIVSLIGVNLAASLILECERKYWQSRNLAGQVQKNRQDRLGMGWANHDHHTFRSSRKQFPHLVHLFEILGFHCRERYYAGKEAGWGAQIMENPKAKLVLFLDVDLSKEEIAVDFAHQAVPELKELGTIGLWCALHGDSILKAGMHHLEAQFMFDDLTQDLAHTGIRMMDPFSSFPYLKQAFTAGEIWHVENERVDPLVKSGKITVEQAEKFKNYGAVGSHLENLQRREGYKGFNQKNVSVIITKTNPLAYDKPL